MKETKKFFISLFISFVASALGSYFTFPSIRSWYALLNKPSFNPPNWIFGPIWTILYLMMAISFYIVWRKRNLNKITRESTLYFIQLFLNSIWSVLFFGLKKPLFAFVDIIFLWFFILFTVIFFYKKSKLAAYLLVPYLLWVSFASILNFWIVVLN